jgi:hypothetical protein
MRIVPSLCSLLRAPAASRQRHTVESHRSFTRWRARRMQRPLWLCRAAIQPTARLPRQSTSTIPASPRAGVRLQSPAAPRVGARKRQTARRRPRPGGRGPRPAPLHEGLRPMPKPAALPIRATTSPARPKASHRRAARAAIAPGSSGQLGGAAPDDSRIPRPHRRPDRQAQHVPPRAHSTCAGCSLLRAIACRQRYAAESHR